MIESIELELELAVALYEQMFKTRAKTDGRLMELESFIVRHFGHAGTSAIRIVSERHSEGPIVFVETPKQGRKFRQFVHPESKNKPGVQSNQVLKNTTPKSNVTAAIQSDAPVVQSDAAPGGENPPLTSNELPAVAVDGGGNRNATTDNDAPVESTIDTADAQTMKAAAFGKKYGVEILQNFLAANGVKYEGDPSLTQLAQLTIQKINSAK